MTRCAAIAALALLVAANAAGAAPSSSIRKPTLLWQTYPLVQRPSPPRFYPHAFATGNPQALPLQAQPGGSSMPTQTVLLLLLGSVTAAFAGLLIVRSALSNAPVPTRPEVLPREASKSDGMDLLVALRPANRRKPPPLPLRALPDPNDEDEEHDPEPTARRTALPAPRQLEPEAEPLQPARVETSKVVLWRGQLKYQLYVASLADDAGWRPLSVSPFFRLDDETIPTEQARTALKLLVKQLEREDWTVVSEGPRWYELKLERSRE